MTNSVYGNCGVQEGECWKELKRYQGFSSNTEISMKGHKFNVNYAKGIHIKK